MTITKSQYPNINWSLIDYVLSDHNKKYHKAYEFIVTLERPPFKNTTPFYIYCPQHPKHLTLTTVAELELITNEVCTMCTAKNGGKWKPVEDYQKQLNEAFGTNNYQIYLNEPYKGAHTYVKLLCRKHNKFSKINQIKKLTWEARKYPDTFWQCKQCERENKKLNR